MIANTTEETPQKKGFRGRLLAVGHSLVGAHESIEDVGAQRTAMFSATLSLGVLITSLIGVVATSQTQGFTSAIFFALSGLSIAIFLAFLFSRSRYYRWGAIIFTVALSAIGHTLVLSGEGNINTTLYATLPLAFSIGAALMTLPGMTTLVFANIVMMFILGTIMPTVSYTNALSAVGVILPIGVALILGTIFRNDIERQRLEEVTTYSQELQELSASLEQRVEAATRELGLANQVAQRISLLRDLEPMLSEAVNLIQETFDLYYAQIYLVDPSGRSLHLRAGTGELGKILARRGHRLPIDGRSLNGLAVTERRSILVEDTQSSELHRPNPLLPETRSELTVPMIAGDRVVGVLDLQSNRVAGLSDDKLSAFEALAGQLAVAIENSNLFEQVDVTQQALKNQALRLSTEGWQEFMDAIEVPERMGYSYDREEVLPLDEPLPQTDDENSMMTPIEILGQKVGALRLEGETAWSSDDAELISTVSNQLAQQIENLRLLSRSERYRREAEQAVRRLTREGWDEFQMQTDSAYMYDGKQVVPLPTNGDGPSNQTVHSFDVHVRDEPVGEFNIVGRDTLSDQDQVLVSEINQQISAQIERLRLQQQTNQALADTEEQTVRLAALNRLSDALNRTKTLDDINQVSATHLAEIVESDRTNMSRLIDTEEGQMLEIIALLGEGGAIPTGAKIPIEGSAIGKAVTSQREVVIPDLEKPTYLENAQLVKQGLHSFLVIPLMVAGQPIGTVNFGNAVKNAYSDSDRDIAVQAVSLIASAIEIRNLFEQSQSALERTDILYSISQNLNEAETDEEIIQTVSRPAFEAGAVSATLISLDLDDAGEPIWAEVKASMRSDGQSPVPIGTRYHLPELPFSNLWLSDPDNPILVPDVRSDDRLDDVSKGSMEQSGSRAIVIIPLTQAGERLGLIVINFAEPHEFAMQEAELYRALIDLTSPVLRSRRLFERTQLEADQEALINRISQQIQGTTTVDDALQVAIRELGRALDAKWTSVQIG
jgi:GAF domain-containing protein